MTVWPGSVKPVDAIKQGITVDQWFPTGGQGPFSGSQNRSETS